MINHLPFHGERPVAAARRANSSAKSGGRRAFLRRAAGIGLAFTALGLLRDQAKAQEATPAGNAATPLASPTSAVAVQMTDQFRFMPEEVALEVGQAVTWVNASAIPHTSTDDPAKNPVAQAHPEYAQLPAGAEPWDSGLLQPGQTFTHTFTVPGTYAYFCIPHVLSGMRGTITVQG